MAIVSAVGVSGEFSLDPYPVRSYCKTRVKGVKPRTTAAKIVVLLARPGIMITSGELGLRSVLLVLSHSLWVPMSSNPDLDPVFQSARISEDMMGYGKESFMK